MVTKGAKGGRKRLTKLYGTPEEKELCVSLCLKAKDEKVYSRKDKKGIVYDKHALFVCSYMLGYNCYEVSDLPYLYN